MKILKTKMRLIYQINYCFKKQKKLFDIIVLFNFEYFYFTLFFKNHLI